MTEGAEPTSEITSPAATVVLPTADSSSSRPAVIALTFLAIAAGGFLIGIAIASTFGVRPAGAVLASQQVGPAGATLRFDGGEIRIPPGAVSTATELSVRRTVVPRRVSVRPPGGVTQFFDPGELVAYVFEPSNVEFLRPVSILLRLPNRVGGAATFAQVGETTVLFEGEVDADRGTVELEVRDFRFTTGRPIAPRD